MIEYQYKIVRNEGDEERVYTPRLPTQLGDLVTIEGPNSSGKSTLLHILALGLFGLKNDNVNASLKTKLRDLAGSAHQAVTFSFSIKNEQSGLQIYSEKKNPHSQDLTVYEVANGKRSVLTQESFERKYNLIYDIPEDPLERLDELTKELRDRQASVGRSLKQLELSLRGTITEVNNAQDPKKLEEFRRLQKDAALSISKLSAELEHLEQDRVQLERHYASKFYLEYRRRKEAAVEKLRAVELRLTSLAKEHRVVQKQVRTFSREAENKLEALQIKFDELYYTLKTMKLKTKDDYLSLWKDQDLRRLFIDQEKQSIIFDGIRAFREQVQALDRAISKDGRLEEATFLGDLIGFLHRYSGIQTTLPGTDKTIPEFLAALEQRYKDCREIKVRHDMYLQLDTKLGELEKDSNFFVKINVPLLRRALRERETTGNDETESVQREVSRLRQEVENLNKRCEYFRDALIRAEAKEQDAEAVVAEIERIEHLRPYTAYGEQDLDAKLVDMRDEITKLERRKGETEYNKARYDQEIHRLEQQEPHPYQPRLGDLHRVLSQVQILAQRVLKDYDENLKALQSKKLRKQDLDKGQLAYYDAVAVYLGRRVGSIRHVDKDYSVNKIDLVERKILTCSDKVILLTDLGTGQSQSAYLKGLLSSKDNRKVIALIDEVAMMDSQSMKPIFDMLRKGYKDGSLLAAVVVQKGEQLSAHPISEAG